MAEAGVVPRPRRRHRWWLTKPAKAAAPAPDLLGREFTAPAPDVRWCGDLTEIPTGEGKLYLAATEDRFSRRLLGFALSERHDAELARASLHMAAAVRGGQVARVISTDRGSPGCRRRCGAPARARPRPRPVGGPRSASPARRAPTRCACLHGYDSNGPKPGEDETE